MKPLRVGIVGTGWGELHVQAFKLAKGVQVSALCDIDQDRLKAAAKRHDIPATFSDFQEMLTISDVDWVSIAAPPDAHASMFQAALSRGKHVLCENPPHSILLNCFC